MSCQRLHSRAIHADPRRSPCVQVGTQDGRVKVFGREGVEAMFRSPAQCATAHLQFLDELGAILRLTQARRTELHPCLKLVDCAER